MRDEELRFLVVGCGGIGGVVAASLLRHGHDVSLLTTNREIAAAIDARGLRTRGDQAAARVCGAALTELPAGAQYDFILLCTQPPQAEDAARSVVAGLAPDGAMVVFQNGLCEPRIAAIAGQERVIGGVIAWGASMIEPGLYDRTSAGGFTLGRIAGAPDATVDALGRALECVGPVTTTAELMGARWSKLAINCAISSLGTIGGDRLGVLMRKRYVRRLTLETMTEAVAVARAEGVKLHKVAGTLDLDWVALNDEDLGKKRGSARLFAKHTLLLAVGARYRRLRSSMLNAIERGRTPAVDFLNGEVTRRAEQHGLPAPINDALRRRVWDIAEGRATPSHSLLRALFDETRELAPASVSLRPARVPA
jgi:2-dehydropantoate 2-reductase